MPGCLVTTALIQHVCAKTDYIFTRYAIGIQIWTYKPKNIMLLKKYSYSIVFQ